MYLQMINLDINGRQRKYIFKYDNIYEVEGEAGKNLNLEEDQRINLVGTILDRFYKAEDVEGR